MSENKLDLSLKIDAPEPIVNVLAQQGEELLTPQSKSIGQGISSLLNCVFNPFKYLSQKQEIKYAHKLKLYEKELKEKLDAIPEEKLCEPDFQTVGTAMENSKYCIWSDELRAMFVNLIVRAANIDTKESVHPSFSEIIKQIEPFEAEILSYFKFQPNLAIAEFRNKMEQEKGFRVESTNAFYSRKRNKNFFNSSALSNLERLGLIKISYDLSFTDKDEYANLDSALAEFNKDESNIPIKTTIQHGVATITPLGKEFITICISD